MMDDFEISEAPRESFYWHVWVIFWIYTGSWYSWLNYLGTFFLLLNAGSRTCHNFWNVFGEGIWGIRRICTKPYEVRSRCMTKRTSMRHSFCVGARYRMPEHLKNNDAFWWLQSHKNTTDEPSNRKQETVSKESSRTSRRFPACLNTVILCTWHPPIGKYQNTRVRSWGDPEFGNRKQKT